MTTHNLSTSLRAMHAAARPCGSSEDGRTVYAIHCDAARLADLLAAAAAIDAADAWLARPPVNQCGETCDRAALCATCARRLDEQPAARRYAYSIDGGETYYGAEPTPEDALGSAHDELATECEPGTTHAVHVAKLVPGVEILRRQTTALEFAANAVCELFEEALYDEIGGDEQLIADLTSEQRLHISGAMLGLIAATGAITGQGLADDTVHTITLEGTT